MKKLLLLTMLFFWVGLMAQAPEGMVKINKPERIDSFKGEFQEAKLDTTIFNVQVLNIHGEQAQIIKMGRKYNVSVIPEINPYGYILEADREYTVYLERDLNMVDKFQTKGQSKTIPARMIWFTPSPDQLKRDQLDLLRIYKE